MEQDKREITGEKEQRLRAPRSCGNTFVTDNRITLVPKALPAQEESDHESRKVLREMLLFLLTLCFVSGSLLIGATPAGIAACVGTHQQIGIN